MSIANPNWLNVAGLLYAGIGVLLLATAVATSAGGGSASRSARTPAGLGIGGIGTFGGLLATIGFFMQSMAQFYVVPQGGAVASMLMMLMALLAVYGIAALRSPAVGVDDHETRAVATAPQSAEFAPVVVAPSAVKLVSAG